MELTACGWRWTTPIPERCLATAASGNCPSSPKAVRSLQQRGMVLQAWKASQYALWTALPPEYPTISRSLDCRLPARLFKIAYKPSLASSTAFSLQIPDSLIKSHRSLCLSFTSLLFHYQWKNLRRLLLSTPVGPVLPHRSKMEPSQIAKLARWTWMRKQMSMVRFFSLLVDPHDKQIPCTSRPSARW